MANDYKRRDSTIMELLDNARNNNWKICSYGLGIMGKGTGRSLLGWLKVEPNYYCDRDSEALESYPVAKEKKIHLEELLQIKEDVLVFVFLNAKYSENAQQELEKNTFLHVVTWQELIREDELIKEYFGIGQIPHYRREENKVCNKLERKIKNTDRIAIYTCITNNYDQLNEPLYMEDNCDYFFITDKKGVEQLSLPSAYKIIDIEKVVPADLISPKEKNRYCKSHGYEIFKDYDYSIYLDGNIQIVKPILPLLKLMGQVGVAFHKHPAADDAYEEALSLSLRTRITKEEADKTIKWFWNSGMPRFYGMVECGVILCDNKSSTACELLNNWFSNYHKGAAKRDQMYMAFTLWKMGIEINEVRTLPGNWRENGYFRITSKHTGYQR